MTASDDEFEDFLKRRKPVFRAPDDDMFEPPSELDRVVLRQAREAIDTPRPMRVFRGPRWAAPIALAATVVLAVGVVFYGGMPAQHEPVPEVTVQNVAERVDYPQAAPAVAPAPPATANNRVGEAADTSGALVVELTPAPAEAARYAAPAPAPAPATVVARSAESSVEDRAAAGPAMASAAKAAIPPWRRDTKSWLAEIERLRNAGDIARADAELVEYKRQQRAFAGAPDR